MSQNYGTTRYLRAVLLPRNRFQIQSLADKGLSWSRIWEIRSCLRVEFVPKELFFPRNSERTGWEVLTEKSRLDGFGTWFMNYQLT